MLESPSQIKELGSKPGMVAQACNASMWKVKAEGVRSSRSPSTTHEVVGYNCLKKQKQTRTKQTRKEEWKHKYAIPP